jgi:hypothetical protein
MEWHGRITATDDLPLFEQLKLLAEDSVIVPASAIVPHVEDVDDDDVDDLLDTPTLMPRSPAEDVLPQATAIVDNPARRNLASSFSPAQTRSKTRAASGSTDANIRNYDIASMALSELILSATLQSDPQLGVPKDYKALLKLNDATWFKSMHNELENFISRDAWEFLQSHKLPPGRKTL